MYQHVGLGMCGARLSPPPWKERNARAHCEREWSLETLPSRHLFFLMSWETLLSFKVSQNSLSSWSSDLRKLKIHPIFHLLNLCSEWRSEDLLVHATNSCSQGWVRKLLEHRVWVPLRLFGVVAWDIEKIPHQSNESEIHFSLTFSKNMQYLKPWPQKVSMALKIYAPRAF